jgi:hypothetical protein
MTCDFITVIRARGRRLCKLVHADGTTEGYDSARQVDLHQVDLPDLEGLAALLEQLAPRRDVCLVRGEIVDPARTVGVRRLCHPDAETGDQPTLREAAHRWLALDLDSLPMDRAIDPREIEDCARAVVRRLPEAFHDAACIVQATTSHGIKPGARLRLWYWCSRPVTNAECKIWLAQASVDRTLFTPAQPHYTATPVFAGWDDPLPRRLGRLAGAPVVVPPPQEVLTPLQRPATDPGCLGAGAEWPGGGSAVVRFTALVCAVRRAVEGQRHPVLFWAACRAGEMVAAGELRAESAAAVLAQAAIEAGGRDARQAARTARDGIARGVAEAGR